MDNDQLTAELVALSAKVNFLIKIVDRLVNAEVNIDANLDIDLEWEDKRKLEDLNRKVNKNGDRHD